MELILVQTNYLLTLDDQRVLSLGRTCGAKLPTRFRGKGDINGKRWLHVRDPSIECIWTWSRKKGQKRYKQKNGFHKINMAWNKKFEWMGRNNNKHSEKVNTLQKYMVLIVALIDFYCRVLTMDNKDTQKPVTLHNWDVNKIFSQREIS